MKKAKLILESGEALEGFSFGAETDAAGELVFTTASGYCEVLTDARSAGSLVLFTFPLLGNYGVPEGDMPDGAVKAAGVISREVCPEPSNFRCAETLGDYLRRNGIPGICGVDTRRVTQLLRENGVVRAVISHGGPVSFAEDARDLVAETTCSSPYTLGSGKRAAVLDLGAGRVPAEALAKRGFEVTVFPADTGAGTILAGGFSGCVLSAGPGSPYYAPKRVETVSALAGSLPLMGLGLGHQLLALALGGKCERLPFGHHGGSPVKEVSSGRVIITDQNHLWCVSQGGAPGAVETYVNLTDGSCEGL
ncbi:MAG: carbamoyl phosphate synthase small subunit, partial [Oscillospiraceae bacterium]|nr:carbamoyl phosphate synthase small subunit [Oscillospiraceae bacterium]